MYKIVGAIYAFCYFLYHHKIPILPGLLNKILLRLLFSVQISLGAKIGKNAVFAYGGLGVVVHSSCEIDDNVKIGTGVLLGGRELEAGKVPKVGKNCIISTGAKLLGPITIGDNCVIGANAVVIEDVPSNCVVAGVPAKIVKTNIDINDYRTDLRNVT